MTRRSAPKARLLSADTRNELGKTTPLRSASKPMKSAKRKREAAPAAPATEAAPEQPIVVLPANCTLREAAELKGSLLRWAATADTVQLDVSALQRIDTAAIQVLCAFARDRQNRQLAFTWEGDTTTLLEAAGLLGVAALLGLPAAAQA